MSDKCVWKRLDRELLDYVPDCRNDIKFNYNDIKSFNACPYCKKDIDFIHDVCMWWLIPESDYRNCAPECLPGTVWDKNRFYSDITCPLCCKKKVYKYPNPDTKEPESIRNQSEQDCGNCYYSNCPYIVNKTMVKCHRYPQDIDRNRDYWCGEWKPKNENKSLG